MGYLSGKVEFVIGVDTHKRSHTACVVDPNGGELAGATEPADATGYRRLLAFSLKQAPQRRVWAVEGTGSFGSGLTSYLLEHGEWVVEVDRPARPARRSGAKSDELDAARAAREALAQKHLTHPRRRGDREALRVLLRTRQGALKARCQALCHLKALVVTAPHGLRQQLRGLSTDALVGRCTRMRISSQQATERRATVMAMRATARRTQALQAEADDLESEIKSIVRTMAPVLLGEPGVGDVSAAEILMAWSHPGRFRSDAAFASLAGAAPIPASSGQVVRHRLNRGGDRQLNRALHIIVLSRLRHHDETRAYAQRRTTEGKSSREIRRCLKRYVARRLFKLLESTAMAT